jgi:hypothetical protein
LRSELYILLFAVRQARWMHAPERLTITVQSTLLETATAFGVRLLGAALVVDFGFVAMIGAPPTGSCAIEIPGNQDDYQSGAELPHSKGSADYVVNHNSALNLPRLQ